MSGATLEKGDVTYVHAPISVQQYLTQNVMLVIFLSCSHCQSNLIKPQAHSPDGADFWIYLLKLQWATTEHRQCKTFHIALCEVPPTKPTSSNGSRGSWLPCETSCLIGPALHRVSQDPVPLVTTRLLKDAPPTLRSSRAECPKLQRKLLTAG